MTVITGNFPELLWPGIAEIWGNKYNDYSPCYTLVFQQKNSDKAFEKEQGVTGLPLAAIKDQGDSVTFEDPLQGFQKEYVNVTYGLGGQITREMYDDDQYNYINQLPEMLARSLRQTEETVHFNHFNNGFTAAFTGADGVILFSTAHVTVGGATYRNTLTTAADLTQTSLEQATTDLMDFVDDRNLKIQVMPKILLVPTANHWNAKKILETDRQVDSADNTKNVMNGIMTPVTSPYLTDPDAWYITTDVPNGLITYNRRAAEIDRDNVFETQNLRFIVTRRFSSGWTDPRGAYGSPGA